VDLFLRVLGFCRLRHSRLSGEPCAPQSQASTGTSYLILTNALTGGEYRVRPDYIRSATDTANINTDGGWSYFIVEP
jgi:hypothetical protein